MGCTLPRAPAVKALSEGSEGLELGGGNGTPLDVGGTLVLPLEWRGVRRVTS